MQTGQTLTSALADLLRVNCALDKATAVRKLIAQWQVGGFANIGDETPPARPGRPDRPQLRPPREVPRRRISRAAGGRVALVHAIAHIELNAIDLALDMACRYVAHRLPHVSTLTGCLSPMMRHGIS